MQTHTRQQNAHTEAERRTHKATVELPSTIPVCLPPYTQPEEHLACTRKHTHTAHTPQDGCSAQPQRVYQGHPPPTPNPYTASVPCSKYTRQHTANTAAAPAHHTQADKRLPMQSAQSCLATAMPEPHTQHMHRPSFEHSRPPAPSSTHVAQNTQPTHTHVHHTMQLQATLIRASKHSFRPIKTCMHTGILLGPSHQPPHVIFALRRPHGRRWSRS